MGLVLAARRDIEAQPAVDRDLARSLDAAVAAGNGTGAPLYALPTYTALLDLHELLARRGLTNRWSG